MPNTQSTPSCPPAAALSPAAPQRLGLALACAVTAALLAGCATTSTPFGEPAVVNATARLACPVTPNCVTSVGEDGLPPLRYEGTPEQGMARLRATLAAFEGARIEAADALSLTAQFTTRVGFRDEVVFVLDPAARQIHFRSRSLLGLYDFGKNRSRMKAVSERFAHPVQPG